MRLIFVLPIALLASVRTAAAQVVVHPSQYATTEGVGNNWYPFRYAASAGHYQQGYEASQFPGPIAIGEISFRYKDDRALPGAAADFKITLAHCATAWNALAPTFANNIGVGATVVFDGTWNIPAFAGHPAVPNPFTARLTLTTPFFYYPARGDLIMDIEMRSSTAPDSIGAFAISHSNVGASRIHADTGNPTEPTGTVGSAGLITEFSGPSCNGTVVTIGMGCTDLSGTRLAMYVLGCPDLGATLAIGTSTGAGVTESVFLVMGVSDQSWLGIPLPLDLGLFGAPGCAIHTSQEATIGPLGNPGGGAGLQLTIPQDPSLLRATLYWQGYILQPGINTLGIGSSDYVSVRFG